MDDSAIALVTGANRGIGFEVCRQLAGRGFRVVLGARDPDKGEAAAAALAGAGLDVSFGQLDVTDPASIAGLRQQIEDGFGRLDVLVNNAAILYDDWQRAISADLGLARQAWETNTL